MTTATTKREEMNVLIVDDNQTISTLMKEYIRPHFKSVHMVSTQEGAESLLAQEPIDLVLMDFYLFGKSGSDVIVDLKKRFPNLKYILTSSDEDIGGQTNLPFIPKGFSLEQLSGCVTAAFGREVDVSEPTTPRVLIVTEHHHEQQTLSMYLGQYDVRSVGTIEEAQILLDREDIKAVVLDKYLSTISFAEALTWIRSANRDAEIIILDKTLDPTTRDQHYPNEMHVIHDPKDKEGLLAIVTQCLDRSKQRQELKQNVVGTVLVVSNGKTGDKVVAYLSGFYAVQRCLTSEEGKELTSRHQYDLVLVDDQTRVSKTDREKMTQNSGKFQSVPVVTSIKEDEWLSYDNMAQWVRSKRSTI